MSHHSTDDPLIADEFKKMLKESSADGTFEREKNSLITQAKAEQLKNELGPTNTYPRGKMSPSDEGGLMMGITNWNGRVIIDFGKPVRSVGFTKQEAIAFAEMIIARAECCPDILFPTAQPQEEGGESW